MSLEIGLRLKQARESLGLTIQDIRDQTRIESGYLIALENGEFDKLPSPYFVRTCIRAYAKCVGIEPHHLLKKYHPIPGDSGASDSTKNRNTGRQKAVQDRSRFTSTFPRISAREESAKTHDEDRGRQTGARGVSERTMRMDSLSQRTDPNVGAGFSSGDTDPYGSPSRRANHPSDQDRASGDPGVSDPMKNRNTGRQKAIQDRSRFTSRLPRISAREESAKTHDEDWGRQTGARGVSERTMRMDSLSQRTDPNVGAGFSSGDTDPYGISSRRGERVEPGSIDEEQEGRYRWPEGLSTRSRRSERAKEGLPSRKIRWVGAVAGVALLIPAVTWGVLSLLKDDPPAETPNRSAKVEEQSKSDGVNAEPLSSPETEASEEGGAEVTLVENSGGVAHYQTASTGELLVEIGPVTDVCWMQIREKRQGGNYLKDVTLRNNETYRYKHPEDGSSDLYIEFGAPHAVQQIKVNGQTIDSSKIIHIERTN